MLISIVGDEEVMSMQVTIVGGASEQKGVSAPAGLVVELLSCWVGSDDFVARSLRVILLSNQRYSYRDSQWWKVCGHTYLNHFIKFRVRAVALMYWARTAAVCTLQVCIDLCSTWLTAQR